VSPASAGKLVEGRLLLTKHQATNLGELIRGDVKELRRLGWKKFVALKRGTADLHPDVGKLPHPAAHYLDNLRQRGAKVTLATAPWSPDRISEALKRGPHKSSHEHVEFLEGELVDFLHRGQWVVLPASELLHNPVLSKYLRISPMGVVPQRERSPRIIVDYSFSKVNAETTKLAHPEAMQFGKALERILRQIVEADPAFGPVSLIKVDISDGFYRICLNVADIPKLAVAIPQITGTEQLLALPLVLPMGWTESPPYFTAATETVTDLTNQRLQTRWRPPLHRLESAANTPPTEEDVVATAKLPASSTPLPDRIPQRKWKPAPWPRPTSLLTTSSALGKVTPADCTASVACCCIP
jgi:hypothetical protein